MTTADIFSQYFLGIDYAEITSPENRASIDDLIRTGETGVMKALTAKRDRLDGLMNSRIQPDHTTATTLTTEQEAQAQELARTIYHNELCALCAARQAVIRGMIAQ